MAVDPVLDILEQETAHAAVGVGPLEINIPKAREEGPEQIGARDGGVQVAGLAGKVGAKAARAIFSKRKEPLPLRTGKDVGDQAVPGPTDPGTLQAPTPEAILGDPLAAKYGVKETIEGRGEAAPGMTSPHANVDYLKAEHPDDIRRLIKIEAERHEMAAPVETHAELATDVDRNAEKYLKRVLGEETPTGLWNSRELLAGRRLLVDRAEAVREQAAAIRGGNHTPETLLKYQQESMAFAALQKTLQGQVTEVARALSQQRIAAEKLSLPNLDTMNRGVDSMGGPEYIIRHAELTDEAMKTADDAVVGAVKTSDRLSPVRMMVEWWKASILSGIETHLVNISSNTLVNIFETLAVRPVAATIGTARSKLTGSLDHVSYAETMEGIAGYRGIRDATGALVETLTTGTPTFGGTTKAEIGTEGTTQLAQAGERLAGKAGKFVGDAVTVSFRLLQAEDDFFKTLGFLQEMDRLSIREGVRLGFKGDRLSDFRLQVQREPESFPEIMEQATKFAERVTFTDRASVPGLVGNLISAARGLVANHPSLGFIMPFITTPANLVRYATEMSGLPISKQMRNDLAAGGARRDMAMARMTIGLTMTTGIAVLALDGSITGSGPRNLDQRRILKETGWRPNAIRVGDQYFTYNRLDPLGQLLGTIADSLDRARYASTEAQTLEHVMASAFVMAEYTLHRTYMKGVDDFMKMMEKRMKPATFIANYASGFVPWSAALADIEQLVDPQVRRPTVDESGALGAIPGTVVQRIQSRVPGLSGDLRASRNWDGTIAMPPEGYFLTVAEALSPVKWSRQRKPDPATRELIAQGVPAAEPSPLFNYAGVEFSVVELDEGTGKGGFYDKYVEVVGRERRKLVEELIGSGDYGDLSDGPEGLKASVLRRVIAAGTKVGRNIFWEEHFAKLAERNKDSLSPLAARILKEGVESLIERAHEGDKIEGIKKKRKASQELPVPTVSF